MEKWSGGGMGGSVSFLVCGVIDGSGRLVDDPLPGSTIRRSPR
jgi:hypothetical protein